MNQSLQQRISDISPILALVIPDRDKTQEFWEILMESPHTKFKALPDWCKESIREAESINEEAQERGINFHKVYRERHPREWDEPAAEAFALAPSHADS